MNYKFPKEFKWGSATSSHQVEGGNHNDWTEWESSPARIEKLKKEGKDPANFISGKACDSYNRYEEDFDIVKNLNQNIHRFSIEWSRIEPEEGKFNEKELQHYVNVVKALKSRGIEPMITLWHFTNPIWFAKKGGWANSQAPDLFVRYMKVVVSALRGENVKLWITFNEATTVYSGFSYLKGLWPPHHKSILEWRRANKNIIKAHINTYREIKEIYRHSPDPSETNLGADSKTQSKSGDTSHNVEVGMAESLVFVPDTKNFFKTLMRRIYKRLRNFYFLNSTAPYYDFIGLNYYHMDRRPYFTLKDELIPPHGTNQDMHWETYPPGIYHCLSDLRKYNKPVYITENGLSDDTDSFRENFIKDHLKWVHKAIEKGIDVKGYLYWSLLDNFEWHHGYGPRFGLVEVDYQTLARHIRPSALEYAKICRENTLTSD
jgi:beta-glucosidase